MCATASTLRSGQLFLTHFKSELDKDHQTMTWLECEATTNSAGKRVVDTLKCKVCSKFKSQLQSKRVSSLHRLSDDEKAKLGKKFEIAYFVATENLYLSQNMLEFVP